MTNKIIIAGNVSQDFKDRLAARLAKDVVTKSVPTYEIRKDPTPDSPCYDVYKDGKLRSSFTGLTAAKAFVDHVTKWDAQA